MEQITLISQKL